MKHIAFAFIMLSTTAFAAPQAQIICRDYNGKVTDALSGDWDTCMSEIYSGEICFKGDRAKALQILKSDDISSKFEGTDGEGIRGVWFQGTDSIAYRVVDEPNEWSAIRVIKACKK